MLMLFGLLHARRFHALIVLMLGVVALTWAQRLMPDAKPTRDPHQVVASAWTHELPLAALGLGAEAAKRHEADAAAKHQNEAFGPATLLGQSGEGWYPFGETVSANDGR